MKWVRGSVHNLQRIGVIACGKGGEEGEGRRGEGGVDRGRLSELVSLHLQKRGKEVGVNVRFRLRLELYDDYVRMVSVLRVVRMVRVVMVVSAA